MRLRAWFGVLGVAVVLVSASALPAVAHVTTTQGPFRVAVGWRDEPAYAGVPNAIEVEVSRADGRNVEGKGSLDVEVSHGADRIRLPLLPGETPGLLSAQLVPTVAGTYGLHVTGAIDGTPIDIQSTCSEKTFDCVADGAEIQFPARQRTTDELVTRLERELARRSQDDTTARVIAIAAIVLAGAALMFMVHARRSKGARRE